MAVEDWSGKERTGKSRSGGEWTGEAVEDRSRADGIGEDRRGSDWRGTAVMACLGLERSGSLGGERLGMERKGMERLGMEGFNS